jgi:S-DNA-T family DNA segregation ATPase FtsK/SpoIIIE
MLTDHIIGRVGADILAKHISRSAQSGDSAALFRLDKLSSSQIAAVARAILANPDLLGQVDLMIPETLVEGQGLPAEILISHNAGYVRNNAETSKASILTANGNEYNLADTLGHVMAIGAREMRADSEPWVNAALHVGGISPVPDDRAIFQAALDGLLASSELSLVQLGEFCAEIVEAISTHGLPIRDAVGYAMPCTGLPRDSGFFSNAKSYGQSKKPWQKAFSKILRPTSAVAQKTETERPAD